MEMDPRLREAAESGNIDVLYVLIQEDPYILELIEQIPFIHTPLHIAANKGQVNFAREMLNLKPSFARKLNGDGFSPMHLAVMNGETELVLRLLKTDKDLARIKGREGMTPFHYVVARGNLRLLVEFLVAYPGCIEDVTVRDETAFHLALSKDQTEAFSILIGWLQRTRHTHGSIFAFEKKLVNWKDNHNNTVLHIAAMNGQHQALKLLFDSQLWLDVKAKNSEGLTAKEIIENVEQEGLHIDMSDEGDTKIKQLKEKVVFERIGVVRDRTKNSMSVDMINTMLVVMALVITAIYQSSLSPPGGVWQDDNNAPSSNSTIRFNFGKETRGAGTTIMNPWFYTLFWYLNLTAFGYAVLLTMFLLSNFRLFLLIIFPLYFLMISYFGSMAIISPSTTWLYFNLVLLFCILFFNLFLVYLVILFSKKVHRTMAEIKYRTRMRKALRMDDDVGIIQLFLANLMFCTQYILDSVFSIWMPSA